MQQSHFLFQSSVLFFVQIQVMHTVYLVHILFLYFPNSQVKALWVQEQSDIIPVQLLIPHYFDIFLYIVC